MRRVYVTGLGFITSIGNDAATVAGNLRRLRHGVVLYPPFQRPEIPIKVAAPIREFCVDSIDPEDWTYPEKFKVRRDVLRGLAPHGLYAYCAMLQAIQDARLGDPEISNPQTGLYAASGGSPLFMHHLLDRLYKQGVMRCPPLGIVASVAGTLNFNLVSHFKIRGASTGFASACASSGHALGFAYDEIALGRQQRMFVVGAEDANLESILPFAGMRALSTQTDPGKASRPFAVGRDGFVGTGGATVLVLESDIEIARREARPYCEIVGWGQASDGHNVAISHPDGLGLRSAMENALQNTGLAPGDVDYVNAHATSTTIGDISEARALRAVFGSNGHRPAISSTKALTGHGLSLSSAMETGFCALATRDGFTPGSAHIETLDPECVDLNIIRATLPQGPRVTMSNSSGFGGANVSIILRRVG